jgi:hypothetical protein
MKRSFFASLAMLTLAMPGTSLLADDTTTITFDDGPEGWVGPAGPGGTTVIETSGGNPGSFMRTVFNNFGITFFNTTNPVFLGDYTQFESVTLSVDVRVEFLNFFGQDTSRPWLVDFRDFDTAQGAFPWTSVFFVFDDISQEQNAEWTTYSVTFDPNSIELPDGWGGFGAEDPVTFEPILPDGVSFADVLSGVDVITLTTLQPGFFFGFTDHTVGIDNIRISHAPPACAPDLNGDGSLNFFDVSAFLTALGNQDPIADFNSDGSFNFFDVSAFLSAFADGCP